MKNLAHPVKTSSRDQNRFAVAPIPFLLSLESTALALGLLDFFPNLCQGTFTLEDFLANVLYYLCVAQAIILPFILAVPFLFRVLVDERGIGEHNLGDRRRQTAWDQITAVKPCHFLALPVLRLYFTRTNGRPASRWLLLSVANPEGLWHAVERYAPLGSPVREFGYLRHR